MDANEIATGLIADKHALLNGQRALKHDLRGRRSAIASAARGALQAMLSNPELTSGWNPLTDTTGPARYAFVAVAYATALVDEIKRTEAANR